MDKATTLVNGVEPIRADDAESPEAPSQPGPSSASVDDAKTLLGDDTEDAAIGGRSTPSSIPNHATAPEKQSDPPSTPTPEDTGTATSQDMSMMDVDDTTTSIDASAPAGADPTLALGLISDASASDTMRSRDDAEMGTMQEDGFQGM